MQIKDGVRMPCRQEMRVVLIAADRVWKARGQELTITSGMDGAHSAGSYHYYGWAVDLRTRYFSTIDIVRAVAQELRAEIVKVREGFRRYTREYKVMVESDHIHVQYEGDK